MTAGSIAHQVHARLPHLSLLSQAIVDALLLSGGPVGTARELAPRLGLTSRFQLARLLKRDGLPPLHALASWAQVLMWLDRAERDGSSLCELAFHSRKDPAVCYRTVKRVTGLAWTEALRRGSRALVTAFLKAMVRRR